jgi:hypothetical protein
MSEDNLNIDANDIDLENPVIDGQVEESDGIAEAPIEEIDIFDYTQFANNRVRLQVDGEEVLVPLEEALAGYQRQADYTRKTQELSEQRKQIQFAAALQEALDDDPVNTLQILQQHYGVAAQALEGDEEWLDPMEVQYRNLEQRLEAFEQQKALEDLERTIDSLKAKYGDEFEPEEVVAKAYAKGSTDLEAVFKQLAFDKVYAEAQVNKKKNSEETTRTQAKREASIVSGGSSAKTTTPIKANIPKSVFEAYEQAQRSLNL